MDTLNDEIGTKSNMVEHYNSQIDELTEQLQASRQENMYLNQALAREQAQDVH